MNQLYRLNLRRVLATRYKKSLSFSQALSLSSRANVYVCGCKIKIRISVTNFLRAAIKYAISFLMYYILYFVCICVVFFRALSSVLLLSIGFSQSAKTIMYLCMSLCGYVLFLHVLLLLLFLLLAPRSI